MTPRSLVGMTMGARKRWAWDIAATNHRHRDYSDPAQLFNAKVDSEQARQWAQNLWAARTGIRIGQRLRPCPGCEKCTDSPRLLVLGWTRRIGGYAKLTRIYSRWHKRAEYLLMIYRPGPTWNPAAGGGVTKAEVWQNMADCLRTHDQLKVVCDGSGVLPAKGKARPCSPK